ncbi:MAG: hypothetical protein HY847_12370 [Betaproteobacteria bacterium]|nr:hypothetical protein [Betaproteobacteria bacterium]
MKLFFKDGKYSDVFSQKNNKTVLETLAHRRYVKLRRLVEETYANRLQEPLGSFLLQLKRDGDDSYRRFLNRYGDANYSVFQINDKQVLPKRGIYAYTFKEELRYIGRCQDSMRKRVNQGYGKIHPKNCYLDGQATNCHLNTLITAEQEAVRLWFCELELEQIVTVEKSLISEYQPPWNIQRCNQLP